MKIRQRRICRSTGSLLKKNDEDMNDELRPEYDLRNLRVRRVGPGRARFGATVQLEADVAEVLPDSESVNEALRFLIRITRESKSSLPGTATDA